MERQKYESEIKLYRKDYVEGKVAEFNKKAVKLGVEPANLIWGDERHQSWTDEFGMERVTVFLQVTLEYSPAVVPGYELIGRFELVSIPIEAHEGVLGNITTEFKDELYVYPAPNKAVPKEYWGRDKLECQHCGHNRYRKSTFLFRNLETDEYIEVGSTCMKDFLGHDPRSFMLLAGFDPVGFFVGDGDGEFDGFRTTEDPVYSLEGVLAVTGEVIDRFGWVPRWKVEENPYEYSFSTSDIVSPNLHPTPEFMKSEIYIEGVANARKDEAKEVIEYFKGIEPESDYELNANTLARSGWVVVPRQLGIACSLVGTYRRIKAKEKENEFDASKSNWFGEIKERLDLDLEVYFHTTFPGYMGGSTDLYLLKTDDGNVVKFTYSGYKLPCLERGDRVRLRGTVKDHSEYKGVKQTVLTRVVLVEE